MIITGWPAVYSDEATIDDPEAYSKPSTTGWIILFHPGMEPYEYICQEDNTDVKHLVAR